MQQQQEATDSGNSPRHNNFGFIRLLLASFVIFAHSPELKEGNRSHEILTQIFHTISLGELAVDGFFILSGYLITQSWQRDPLLPAFMEKRIRRIYPGFIVAVLISAFLIGLVGAGSQYFAQFNYLGFVVAALLLTYQTPPTFVGNPFPITNGSIWTIPYEFICYLLVAVFGMLGLLRQRFVILGIFLAFLTVRVVARLYISLILNLHWHYLSPSELFRLTLFFLAGICFCLFQEKIPLNKWGALIATVVMIPCLFSERFSSLGVAIGGTYLLFWFAYLRLPALQEIGNKVDLSYGIYLYAWPVQKCIIWWFPTFSPWLISVITLPVSAIFALGSWFLIEKPSMKRKPKRPLPAAG